ncbi:hypothetical protein ACIQZB_43480 [Streptomyces sp. NPDC097727]|uniref:hypothetical protein n=1 Tax=Streptomyces sp. NPDC097727 TaxID=3366092 RepID=UPI00382959D4
MGQDAYGLAEQISTARGWKCRPQGVGGRQARLVVDAERRWLGITVLDTGVVLLAAGTVTGGTPGDPVAETSATATDLDGLLGEVDLLWQRL